MNECTREVRQALRTRNPDRPLESIGSEILLIAHRECQTMGDIGTVMAIWSEWDKRGRGED